MSKGILNKLENGWESIERDEISKMHVMNGMSTALPLRYKYYKELIKKKVGTKDQIINEVLNCLEIRINLNHPDNFPKNDKFEAFDNLNELKRLYIKALKNNIV